MRRGIKDCIEPNSWTGERLLPQVITAFFREQSACNGRPATCGLRRSCFDLRRDATMRTAPRAALAAYRGHDARPQGDFLRLPSLLASRPTVVEPVPGRAVYHAAWSMPRTQPNDVCLHALHPPSCCVCGRAWAWRLSRRPRAAPMERAPCFGREAHAAGVLLARRCPWRWPRAREA